METYEELYDTICRVCLSYGDCKNMVNLTDETALDGLSCYGKAVCIFTNIQFTDRTLPNKMCNNCLFRLKQAIIFKKTCENSDQKLAKLAKKINSSQSDFKQELCDFVMFTNSFQREVLTECSTKGSSNNKTSKCDETNESSIKTEANPNAEDESDFEDLFPPAYQEKTELSLTSDSQDLDYDEILDKIEKVVEMPTEQLNVYRKKYARLRRGTALPPDFKNSKVWKTRVQNSIVRKKQKTKIRSVPKQKDDLQCKICKKVLSNMTSLYIHIERHNDGGQYICEHCGKKYPTKAELQYHLASTHDVGPQHVCKVCGFKAPKKLELIEHERIHTGERPYTCEKCGLTFRRRYIWSKHALCHMEKKEQCPQCPKKFSQPRDVLAHINNVHDRMYLFACSQCDVTYARSTTVRRHLVEKHGIAREMQGKIKRINLAKCSVKMLSVPSV